MNFQTRSDAMYAATTVLPMVLGMLREVDWDHSQKQGISENIGDDAKIEMVYNALQSHFKDYFHLNRFFVELKSKGISFEEGEISVAVEKDIFINKTLEQLSYFVSEVTIPTLKNEVKTFKRMGHVYKKPVRVFYDEEVVLKVYLDANGYVENLIKVLMLKLSHSKASLDIEVFKKVDYWASKQTGVQNTEDSYKLNTGGGEKFDLTKFGKNVLTSLNPFGDTLGDRRDNIEAMTPRKQPVDRAGVNISYGQNKIRMAKFTGAFVTNHDNPVLSYNNENQLGEISIHFGYRDMEFETSLFSNLNTENN